MKNLDDIFAELEALTKDLQNQNEETLKNLQK